jgi:hypothetical protein
MGIYICHVYGPVCLCQCHTWKWYIGTWMLPKSRSALGYQKTSCVPSANITLCWESTFGMQDAGAFDIVCSCGSSGGVANDVLIKNSFVDNVTSL